MSISIHRFIPKLFSPLFYFCFLLRDSWFMESKKKKATNECIYKTEIQMSKINLWLQGSKRGEGDKLKDIYMCAKSLQLCLTLCDPMNYSPPDLSVHGILQASILGWVAMSSSRGSS